MLVWKCIASTMLLGRMMLPEGHWVLAAPVCWLAGTFGAGLDLSLKMQHPSLLGGNKQKALGEEEDHLHPWTLPGASMKMQLNNSSLFPAAPFLRERDCGKGGGAWWRADWWTFSASLPLCWLRMPNSLQQSFLAWFWRDFPPPLL